MGDVKQDAINKADSVKEIRLAIAVQKAQDAFWASIAESYPEAKSGDFPPDVSIVFDAWCKSADGYWVRLNC